jgi:dipeptidyl aminopeptidase/acylaminoacyl peptidase
MAERGWLVRRTAVVALLLALVVVQSGLPSSSTPSIVFSAYPNGAGIPQLFHVEADGQALAQLTTGRRAATSPDFSPDGKRIVFVWLGSGIYSIAQDGTGTARLTSGRRDSYPVWSPDGKRIAFLRPYRAEWRVYVMSPAGKGQRRLPLAPAAGRPSWAPNGKAIFVPSAGDMVKIDARSGKILKYYGLRLDLHSSHAATVSPGGQMVSYVGPRNPTGPEDCGEGPCPQFGLYVARLPKPHRARRIANDTGPAGWSRDGKSLVYVARGVLTLRTVAGAGTTSVATGPHVATGDAPPAWQPG